MSINMLILQLTETLIYNSMNGSLKCRKELATIYFRWRLIEYSNSKKNHIEGDYFLCVPTETCLLVKRI